MSDGEKLLTYLNSALNALLGFDIFPRLPKKVKFCCLVKYVKIHIFFTLLLAVTKKTVGDGEKLLTYLNSALRALLGFDIFPLVPKKSEILLPSVISIYLKGILYGDIQY